MTFIGYWDKEDKKNIYKSRKFSDWTLEQCSTWVFTFEWIELNPFHIPFHYQPVTSSKYGALVWIELLFEIESEISSEKLVLRFSASPSLIFIGNKAIVIEMQLLGSSYCQLFGMDQLAKFLIWRVQFKIWYLNHNIGRTLWQNLTNK